MDPENDKKAGDNEGNQTSTHKDGSEAAIRENSTSDFKDQLEKRLADETRLRRYTELVMDARQEELEAQEVENTKLADKLENLKNEMETVYRKLSEAQNLAKHRQKQLQDTRDQIFRLQPRRKDITESEAQASYKALVGGVQRWVESRLKLILDDLDVGRVRAVPSPTQASRFVNLLREPAKKCLDVDQSDEFHVIAVIMNYLWLAFFAKSFYCPLDDGDGDRTIEWINDTETTMARLPRDVGQCREWRVETLTSLTTQASFKSRRTRYINLVSDDLASLLMNMVPRGSHSELQGSLRRTIIEPAANLAHQIHLAPNIYSLKWPARTAPSRLEVYECFNIASGGMTLDLSGTCPTSPARRNVSYLFDAAPGLFVERIDGGKKTAVKSICKPQVVVYAGEGEPPQKLSVARWIYDHAGDPVGTLRGSNSRVATPRRSSGTLVNGSRR